MVFFIIAAVTIAGSIFFTIFASGELQPWAKDDESEKPRVENGDELEVLNPAINGTKTNPRV